MTSDPQPSQQQQQPLLKQKFDNVSLLFLILVLIAILVISAKWNFKDELTSWLMQTTTVVVGAYIGLTQGGQRQAWNPTTNGNTAAVAIKPGETAVVDNISPPAITTKIDTNPIAPTPKGIKL